MTMNRSLVGAAALTVLMLVSLVVALPAHRDVDRWTARLEQLRPSDPLGYYELAEEVADVANDDESIRLARHLFALAGAIDPGRFGRSACLALADLAADESRRRQLQALASLLDDQTSGSMSAAERGDAEVATAFAVCEAMSHLRQGRGERVTSTLRESEAAAFLDDHAHLIAGGAQRFLEDATLYRSGRRPSLAMDDVIRMLQAERAMLTGRDRPWSADLLLEQGEPLVEVDPTRVDEVLGADARRAIYRNGRWVSSGLN